MPSDWAMTSFMPLHVCPITYGNETCMTWESFERMCFANQDNEEAQRCQALCRGYSLPAGLRLIDMQDIQQLSINRGEQRMAKITGKGTCDICGGDERTLRLIKEKSCCASCEFIWRYAHNQPEVLIAAVRSAQGDGWMNSYLGIQEIQPPEEIPDVAIEQYSIGLEEEIKNLKEENARLVIPDDTIEKLKRTLGKVALMLEVDVEDDIVDVAKKTMEQRRNMAEVMLLLGEKNEKLQHMWESATRECDELKKDYDLDFGEESREYATLQNVLNSALDQAATGKGKERHAKEGEPFEKQKICEITRRVGLGFPVGQAIKKAEESMRLEIQAGKEEILGAINYLGAAYIVMAESA